MDEHISNSRENDRPKYLTGPDGKGYVFDCGSRLYKPESEARKEDYEYQHQKAKSPGILKVEVRRDWWVFFIATIISLATFAIVATYTYYAARQVAASENANDVTRKSIRESGRSAALTLRAGKIALADANKNFIESERPYIWTPNVRLAAFTETEPIKVEFLLGNYGKSPAVNERSVGGVFLGPNAQTLADNWFNDLKGKRLPPPSGDPKNYGSLGIIPPGVPVDFKSVADRTDFAGSAIPTKNELLLARTLRMWMVAVAHFEYQDKAGNFYSTNACFVSIPDAAPGQVAIDLAWGKCHLHNEIH